MKRLGIVLALLVGCGLSPTSAGGWQVTQPFVGITYAAKTLTEIRVEKHEVGSALLQEPWMSGTSPGPTKLRIANP